MVSSGPHAGRHGAEVPPEVVEAAKRAMATRDSSAELMELVRDSVDDGATGDVRTLVYSGAGTTMTVLLSAAAGSDRGRAEVTADPRAGDLVVQTRARPAAAAEVAPGRWLVADVPRGPVSLLLTTATVRRRTSWSTW